MKERKDSTGETLPNLEPARSLVMIVFTNTIGDKNFGYAVHDLANVG